MDNQQSLNTTERSGEREYQSLSSSSAQWTSVIPRLALVSSVLLPFAFVPYLLVRRQLIALRRTAESIGSSLELTQRELKAVLLENARLRKDDHVQARVLLRQVQWDVDHLRRDVAALQTSQASSQHDIRLCQVDFDTEKQRIWSQLTALHDLGVSLADIAAFMYEVEVKSGLTSRNNDAHGIDRLRQTAMKLQKLQESREV